MIKKGFTKLGILILYLISLLPFWFLYILSDIAFVIIYYIVHYRRDVVQQNLRNSFPEKTDQERRDIERKYYRYLAELIVETIKMITVSEKQIRKRQRVLLAEQGGVLVLRPTDDALARRHGSDGAIGAGESPQIRDGIAIAQHPVVPQIGPKMLDFAGNGAVRQLAQRRFIKSGEIAHVLGHGTRHYDVGRGCSKTRFC